MQISDFKTPARHPFDMLNGYKHASEKESVLALMLMKCIQAGDFIAVEMSNDHSTMVKDGLLEEVTEKTYKLTEKAIGLLYSQYHKGE